MSIELATPRASWTDIRYEVGAADAAGIAKITIDRPEVRNAFRPADDARADPGVRPGARRPGRSAW